MAVKMFKRNITCFVIIVLIFFCACKAAKLTVPRILLPYNTGVPTNYTLEVKDGSCYKWSATRYDLVSILPLPLEDESDSCTTKVIVSSVSRYPEHNNAIILAEDKRSGQILRCDVVIDVISTIEIVTTTQVLFLEDAPEVFEVIAKNEKGDTFSSLEGVAFQWAVDSETYSNDVHGVLRFLKFAESEYKTPPAIEFWEKKNLHGSMILMEGSKTGTAKVTVKPLDTSYKHVLPYEVSLVIVANLNLKPSHVYLLPGTKIQYNLELIKQGKTYPVILPSQQYYLEVVDSNIAQLDDLTSVLTAQTYGTTNIVAKDRYVNGSELAYLPSAMVHVTVPSYMTFSVYPGDKWSLQEEFQYFISVNIYDRNSYPIHITEAVNVKVIFPPKYFKVVSSSQNGTYHEVFTLAHGSCKLTATLTGVGQNNKLMKLDIPITATQDVMIYEKIKVSPPITLLPWDPVAKPTYTVNLTASGGTGTYNWMSGEPNIASVNRALAQNMREIKVFTSKEGETFIHATDLHIPLFSGSARVSIQNAVSLQLKAKEVEVYINETLNLPLVMHGHLNENSEELMFSDCTQLPLTVDIHEVPKFEYLKESGPPTANTCRTLKFSCLWSGFNRIRVQYKRNGEFLRAAVIVACYKKLKLSHPFAETVTALGSSLDVVFDGGPKPWPNCQENFFAQLSAQESVLRTVPLENVTDDLGSTHIYQATCLNYAESEMSLNVGNKPCPTNEYPVSDKALTKMICAIPQTLVISTGSAVSGRKCPASSDEMISIHNRQDVVLEISVKDNLGRQFYNISSLVIKWSISNKVLANLGSTEGFQTALVKRNKHVAIAKHYQELHPYGMEGSLKVTATITGYKPEVLQMYGIHIKPELPAPISHTLHLNFVEEVEVSPRRLSLFNNPSNKGEINITKGSGYFHVEVSDSSRAKVVYLKEKRRIEVVPLDTGSFSITIQDLCVSTKRETIAQVHVYGISAILLDVLDKVELGKSILASVEVLNEDKQNIPVSVFTLMNLQPSLSSDIISVRMAAASRDATHAVYQINGIKLGQTNIKFESVSYLTAKGLVYQSEAYPIQVFSPLKVQPSNITLVVGSTFQVLCTGGPHPQSTIEYAVEESDKAIVSTGGRVEARSLGKAVLVARSVGYDKNGQRVVFSQDKASINVISLNGIKIRSPLTRMIAGSEMPVYALGLTEQETPFSFGSANPGIEFRWSVSNYKVVSVQGVYSEVRIDESYENNFCARVKAEQDGVITLRLDVVVQDSVHENEVKEFSDEVQIQVFRKLTLLNPEYENGIILLSPNSQLKLKCNRFPPTKVTYRVSAANTGSGVKVSVDSQGMLVAGDKHGTSILTVTAVEDFGISQHLTAVVKVEDIAYLMLKPVVEVKTKDWQLTSVPVGFTIPFVVTYHDNVGRTFNAVTSQLKYRTNRLDLTRITFGAKNDTLIVHVLKPGITVLKVWDSQSFVSPDFIQISAGFAVDPINVQVTVGDVICFGSPLLSSDGHPGLWSSESSIISIHPSSGGAIALAAGSTTVVYYLSASYSTSTQVTIIPADKVTISPGNLQYLTNADSGKSYKVPVILQSSNYYRANNIVGRNCSAATHETFHLPSFSAPFFCDITFNTSYEVRANDVFHVESGFDINDGRYYCAISIKDKILSAELSTLDTHAILSVHPSSAGHGVEFKSAHLAVPFLPRFHINTDKIILTGYQMSAVTISAISIIQECIEVVSSDKAIFEVMLPIKKSNSITFPVRFIDTAHYRLGEHSSLYLQITCLKTKQQVQLPVYLKMYNVQHDSSQFYAPPRETLVFDWQWMLSIAAVVLLILLCSYALSVCKNYIFSGRVKVTSQPVFLNSPNSSRQFSLSPSRLASNMSHRQLSPQEALYESPGRTSPKLWSTDSPPQVYLTRRRPPNVFQ